MITLRLSAGSNSTQVRNYHLAGTVLASDTPLRALKTFEIPGGAQGPSRPPPRYTKELPSRAESVYRGLGMVAGRSVSIDCRRCDQAYWLTVAARGSFAIAADGSRVSRVETQGVEAEADAIEDVLEPALILALALQGVFCLHASSVRIPSGAVAFLGESGSGKSTLAAFFETCGDRAGWRLADDILPVRPKAGGVAALPHFPQHKLPAEQQIAAGDSQRLSLETIYLLEPGESPSRGGVAAGLVGSRAAALMLVRHTVGSRLFGAALLAEHMKFCAETAGAVPVRRLSYPRRFDVLSEVRCLVEAGVAAPAVP